MAASLAALMRQLEETQWQPVESIMAYQYRQLVNVALHATAHSAYFRERLQTTGLRAEQLGSAPGLRSLPVMRRRDLQAAGENLFCRQLPQTHAPVGETSTSGSSGEPVVVRRTAITQLFWLATTLREHLWHQRDFRGVLAVIRANLPPGEVGRPDWGPPVSLLFSTGPAHAMSIATDVCRQAEWLAGINPDYLLTYPTNLAALLDIFGQQEMPLNRLRQIRTIGETLTPELREAASKIFNVEIADTYSSQEVGNIALQCPHSGLYHGIAESLMVEVLDETGEPCQPGQVGRVVISDLHNYATPLIRYELGDYAEVGEQCPCGRGLPTFKRIAGRLRNMVLHPDGRRHWPLVGFQHYRDIAPIRQYQLIQRSPESIEVRLVADSQLTTEQESRMAELIRESLGFPFQLQFVYFSRDIPRSLGGKFEEFACEVE